MMKLYNDVFGVDGSGIFVDIGQKAMNHPKYNADIYQAKSLLDYIKKDNENTGKKEFELQLGELKELYDYNPGTFFFIEVEKGCNEIGVSIKFTE